jgi:TolB protein
MKFNFGNKKIIIIAALAVLCLGSGIAVAERVILDITSPTFSKIPIAIPLFAPLDQASGRSGRGEQLSKRMSKDLGFSGTFRVIDRQSHIVPAGRSGLVSSEIDFAAWRSVGADALVTGGFTVSSGSITIEMRAYDTLRQTFVVGKKFSGKIADADLMIDAFANLVIEQFTGLPGVFGSKIAFESRGKRGRKEIFTVDLDGSGLRQVTNTNRICRSPAWSPDGKRIAFTTWYSGKPDIYDIVPGKGKLFPLAGFKGSNLGPAFSPDGRKIAFSSSRDGNAEIYVIRSSGGSKKRLTNNWAIDVSPTWSPDGKRIAFVSARAGNPNIFVVSANGGEPQRITWLGKYNAAPDWSPAGDLIVFARQANSRFDIFAIGSDGAGERQLTFGEGSNEDPSFSPDGRLIVFSSNRDGDYDLYIMEVNGGNVRKLFDLPGDQTSPNWSVVPKLN